MQRTMKETYEDEIQSLQEEIQNLNQQFKENQEEAAFLSHDITKTLESYRRRAIFHVGSTEANVKDLQQIGPFEKDLQFLTAISGIEFTKYLKKTECRTENQTLFKHRLMGQCQSLAFQLEFQTMESQGKGSASYDVTDLNIIMEYGEYADLSKFVCRTEERKNLLLFFRTLSKFAEWCEYRKFIFAQFKEKYSDAVGIPVGLSAEYIVLKNPKLPGCELVIVWKINVNEEGAVIPVFDLLNKIPEQALPFDKMKILQNTSMGFRNLLQVYGIEGSIEKLVRVFCLTEE